MESYLLLFLNSSKNLKPTHDFNFITNWTLNAYTLGQHVGSKWGLGRAMRWVPTVNKEKLLGAGNKDVLLQSAGLYKVQGDAVAAVMGTIYEQFVSVYIDISFFFPDSSDPLFPYIGCVCSTSCFPYANTTELAAGWEERRPAFDFPRRGSRNLRTYGWCRR